MGAVGRPARTSRMARSKRLKVFRTAVGFHDAYVAAPSRKAALAAWGASNDLFAIGAAEQVDDPKLIEEVLARPGEVIRRSRGGLAEQIAALPRQKDDPWERKVRKPRSRKPAPPPTRERLEGAEAALKAFETEASAAIAALQEREDALRREREALEKWHRASADKLEARLAKEKERYEIALARWREL